ncbi:hypothetical protein JCM8097_003759, partial [Rhodosporidiobolus ruineniae]
PIQYGFESVMVNEFDGQLYTCSATVPSGPGYPNVTSSNAVCSVAGTLAGSNFVDGTAYINETYAYYCAHKWRNYGIVWVSSLASCASTPPASERISEAKLKSEIKLYPLACVLKSHKDEEGGDDIESGHSGRTACVVNHDNSHLKDVNIQKQTAGSHTAFCRPELQHQCGGRHMLSPKGRRRGQDVPLLLALLPNPAD